MRIDDEKTIWNKIEDSVIETINEEPFLFGRIKKKVTKEMIYSKSREKEYVVSRQLCQYISKYIYNDLLKTHVSLEAIGEKYGNRTHCTVLHSIKTISNYRDTDEQICNMLLKSMNKIIKEMDCYDDRTLSDKMVKTGMA